MLNEAICLSLPNLKGRPISNRDLGGSAAEAVDYASMRRQLTIAVGATCPFWLINHRDDIVQNAMMAVLRQKEKKRDQASFSPSYLKKAAFTATIDEIRRRKNKGEVPFEAEFTDEDPALVAEEASPEREAISRELAVGLRGCLQELAPPRRKAVTLHLLGYKVPQMAKRMGWTRKQAENLLYRGMKDLRDHLKARGLEP